MRHASFAVMVMCGATLSVPVLAAEVRIEQHGNQFDLTVSVKNGPQDPPRPVQKNQSGTFVFQIAQTMFAESAYVDRVFVLKWSPREVDKPALGAKPFSLEIPVTLRSWQTDDILIEAWPFDGIGNGKLTEYERLSNPGDQWRKLTASLQQASHYSHRVRPTTPEARRAYNSAVDALVAIANEVDWLSPPLGLEKLIRESFERYSDKRGSLLEALRSVDERIWRDLPIIQTKLRGRDCESMRQTFAYLERRREDIQRDYRLPTKRNLQLDKAKEQAEHSACSAPPVRSTSQ
jgi:hypothetical protein